MRFPPPEVIATWPQPNYINPENRGPALMIVELTVLPIALLCLSLRLWVRVKIIRRSWWDDWLMVAAAIFSIGVTICVILATQRYGWNLHVWDVHLPQLIQGRQASIAGQTIFLFASGLTKLSILTSYLRIAPVGSRFRQLTIASMALVFALIWIFLIVLWTQCVPASSYWNIFLTARNCIPEWPPLAGQTISTVITDLLVYVLPMPTLWKLRLPVFQRIALMILFGLGTVVVIAGIMRTYWVHYVEQNTFDVTWDGFSLWIWTAVEVNLGVICGCVPALRPLLPSHMSRKSTTKGGSSSGQKGASTRPNNASRNINTPEHESELKEIDVEEHGQGPVSPDWVSAGPLPRVISLGWSPLTDDDEWKKYEQSTRRTV